MRRRQPQRYERACKLKFREHNQTRLILDSANAFTVKHGLFEEMADDRRLVNFTAVECQVRETAARRGGGQRGVGITLPVHIHATQAFTRL